MATAPPPGPWEGSMQNQIGERGTRVCLCLALVCVTAPASSVATADIDLTWRAAPPIVHVGRTVEVGLYAVSDDGTDQPLAGIDAVISWDPAVLELLGKHDNGPYAWLVSSFPNDAGLEGLNADCGPVVFCDPFTGMPYNDGDALYQAVGQPGFDPPPLATVEGLLVTTLSFRAAHEASTTEVALLEVIGEQRTLVADAVNLGADVTGALESVTVVVAPCGSMGDFDGDCGVDLLDFAQFEACLMGPDDMTLGTACDAADFDGDGDTDLHDVAALQLTFSGL